MRSEGEISQDGNKSKSENSDKSPRSDKDMSVKSLEDISSDGTLDENKKSQESKFRSGNN